MPSPIAATARRGLIARKLIPPKAAARFAARAFCALFRFPTRTVRKPRAVVASATIEASHTGDKGQDRPSHVFACENAKHGNRNSPQETASPIKHLRIGQPMLVGHQRQSS